MSCFSCSKEKSIQSISLLQWYKEAYEKTGNLFWFFKHLDGNEIKIMSNDDFKAFKEANSKDFSEGKYEFSRIDEFRVA